MILYPTGIFTYQHLHNSSTFCPSLPNAFDSSITGYVVKPSCPTLTFPFLREATVTMLVALFPLTMVSSKYNSSPSSYFKFANFKSLFSSNVKVSSFKKLSSAMLSQVERSRSSSTRFNFDLDFCSRFPVTCTTFQIAFFVQQQLLPSDSCPMAIFLQLQLCPTVNLVQHFLSFSFFFAAATFTTAKLSVIELQF